MPLFGRGWKAEVSFDFALRVAKRIEDDGVRSATLSAIAVELAKIGEVEKAKELFEEAIRVAIGIVDVTKRSWVLEIIASKLAEGREFNEAIRVANGIEVDGKRSAALFKIASKLAEAGFFDEAIKVARGIVDDWYRSTALSNIAVSIAKALATSVLRNKAKEYESKDIEKAIEIYESIGDKKAAELKDELKRNKLIKELSQKFGNLDGLTLEQLQQIKSKVELAEEVRELIERYPNISDDIKRELERFERGDYSINIQNMLEVLMERINRYEEFIKTLNELKSKMKSTGVTIPASLTEVNLESVRLEELAELIEKANSILNSKPKINLEVLDKTITKDWNQFRVKVTNEGYAHAYDLKISVRGDVNTMTAKPTTVKGLESIAVEIPLKPKKTGRIPLEIKTNYRDGRGNEFKDAWVVWVDVESEARKVEPYSINIERGIYDPCKGGFLEGEFRRMKEWVNRHDPYAYWLVLSIQNKTGKAIEEWGVELETSSALKFEEARVEGVEYAIKVYESHPEPFRSRYAVGIPKEYGIFIPDGGSHRIYLKMRAEKPKTEYEIRGVFKYAGLEVPVRPKRFKYLCDARTDAEALRVELEKTYTKRDAARLALAFKIIQEMDRMCERKIAKTGEFLEKLSLLKDYTEGLSGKFTKQVEEFARFMKEEQFEYLDEEYKGRVKNLCTRLIDIWISEFLK